MSTDTKFQTIDEVLDAHLDQIVKEVENKDYKGYQTWQIEHKIQRKEAILDYLENKAKSKKAIPVTKLEISKLKAELERRSSI